MFTIKDASIADIPAIRAIAEKTWWPTYSPILTSEQIQYVLDSIYDKETLKNVMENGSQTFIIISNEHGPQGFASFGIVQKNPDVYKLHKIYVLPENHGKGYGKILIEDIKTRVLNAGSNILELNVNRFNKAKTFYEKLGFKVISEVDIPIGPYWMNDFVMRIDIG
jgi:GNAT superfamily N-acetyltransferase